MAIVGTFSLLRKQRIGASRPKSMHAAVEAAVDLASIGRRYRPAPPTPAHYRPSVTRNHKDAPAVRDERNSTIGVLHVPAFCLSTLVHIPVEALVVPVVDDEQPRPDGDEGQHRSRGVLR